MPLFFDCDAKVFEPLKHLVIVCQKQLAWVSCLYSVFMGYSEIHPHIEATSPVSTESRWSYGRTHSKPCQIIKCPGCLQTQPFPLGTAGHSDSLFSSSCYQLLRKTVFTSGLLLVISVHRLISVHTLAYLDGKHNRRGSLGELPSLTMDVYLWKAHSLLSLGPLLWVCQGSCGAY